MRRTLELSPRLAMVAGLVPRGARLADVGTDHAYLPVSLILSGHIPGAIAADLRQGPLNRARQTVRTWDLTGQITFRLCDGLKGIAPEEADAVAIAGMGGETIAGILEAAPWLKSENYRLILQCQSKRPQLRRYLYDNGFVIRRETLAQDGKFIYPVMEVIYAPGVALSPAHTYLSPALLESGSELLPAFLDRVIGGLEQAREGLVRLGGGPLREHDEILAQLRQWRNAL